MAEKQSWKNTTVREKIGKGVVVASLTGGIYFGVQAAKDTVETVYEFVGVNTPVVTESLEVVADGNTDPFDRLDEEGSQLRIDYLGALGCMFAVAAGNAIQISGRRPDEVES